MTIIDLVGVEERKHAPVGEQYMFGQIDGNLNGIRNFYGRLAGSTANQVGDRILTTLKMPMSNAAHVLLLTAKLNDVHTFDALEYVFKQKFVQHMESISNIYINF